MTRFSLISKIVCLLTIAVLAPACSKKDSKILAAITNGEFVFTSATYSVGEAGASVTITVARTGGTQGAVSVSYFTATTGGGTTATAGADYTTTSGTFNWANGDNANQTFNIPILQDALVEGTERVRLVLINPTGGAVLGVQSTAFLDILDDDAPSQGVLQFEVTNFSVNENDGTATITVTRTGGTVGAVGATYNTADNTATAPGDYTDVSGGAVAFADGDATPQTFTVPINDDGVAEPTEILDLSLTAPTGGAALGTNSNATLEIVDNDVTGGLLQFEVTNYGVSEGTTTVTITVTRTGGSTGVVTATYATSNGTATEPGDYTATTNVVTFPDGVTTPQTFTVTIIDDQEAENTENVNLTLTNPTGGAELGGNTAAVLTIVDNDTAGITVTPTSGLTTMEDGSLMPTFDVVLDTIPTANVDIVLSSSNGAEGQPDTFLLTFLADASALTPQTVTVTGQQDAAVDGDIPFTIDTDPATSVDPFYDTLDAADVSLTNLDDDPQISIDDVTLAEGDAGTTNFVFTVTLSAADPLNATTIDFTTADGTATQPGDYATNAGTLNIPATNTTGQITVAVATDTVDELDETFTVVLSNPSNGTITDNTGLGTITNDDDPTITITGVTAAEGSAAGTTPFNFAVTLSHASLQAVDVTYTTADGTAEDENGDDDYTAVAAGVVNIPAGNLGGVLPVSVNHDSIDEANETFTVTVNSATNTSSIIGSPATGTITNDDDPTITITGVTDVEGDVGGQQFDFVVTLSGNTFEAVSVDYSTVNGTATDTNDFTGVTNGVVIIPAGTAGPAVLPVTITQDTIDEVDEQFTVVINSATNTSGIIGSPATGTIQNDDDPTISIDDVIQVELNAGTSIFQFTVTLSHASLQDVTFDIDTNDGSATFADNDYVPIVGGAGTITAGLLTTTIDVTVNGDTNSEANETFTVDLSNEANGTFTDAQGLGTINNDDLPALSVTDVSLAEGNVGPTIFTFRVNMTNPDASNVTFTYRTIDGTATDADGDYNAVPATGGTILAGQTFVDIPVTVNGDLTLESDQTFTFDISGVSVNATISDGSGLGTILNDDDPTISINDVTLAEGSTGGTTNFTFDVTLDQPTTNTVTAQFDTGDGTATEADGDYTGIAGQVVTFNPGVVLQQVTVLVGADFKFEALNETFTATLSLLVNANAGTLIGTGTINNDDATPTISVANSSLAEGNAGSAPMTFVVSLSNPTESAVTFNFDTTDGTAEDQFGDFDYLRELNTAGVVTAGTLSTNIQVTINGDTNPENDETFTVTIHSVVGAGIGSDTATGTITTDDGPTATLFEPVASATNVFLDTHITIDFTEPMDEATTNAAISVEEMPGMTALLGLEFYWATTSRVIVALDIVAPAGIHGDDILTENTTYRVTVATTAEAHPTLGSGLPLATQLQETFTTQPDATPPMVVSFTPIPNGETVFTAPIDATTCTGFDILFNEDMDVLNNFGGFSQFRMEALNQFFSVPIPGNSNGVTTSWNADDRTLEVRFAAGLLDDRELFEWQVQATDANGVWIGNDGAGGLFATENQGVDNTNPTISGSFPFDGQVGLPRTTGVFITPSEVVLPNVINAIQVTGGGATTFDIEYEGEPPGINIEPHSAWPPGATITVSLATLNPIVDSAGRTMAPDTISFTVDSATSNPPIFDEPYSGFKDGNTNVDRFNPVDYLFFRDSVSGGRAYINEQTLDPTDIMIVQSGAVNIPAKGFAIRAEDSGSSLEIRRLPGTWSSIAHNTQYDLMILNTFQDVFGSNSPGETFDFTVVADAGGAEDTRPFVGFYPDAEVLSFPGVPPAQELELGGNVQNQGLPQLLSVTVTENVDTLNVMENSGGAVTFWNWNYQTPGGGGGPADEPNLSTPGPHAFNFAFSDTNVLHDFDLNVDGFVFPAFPTLTGPPTVNTSLTPTYTWSGIPADADAVLLFVEDDNTGDVVAEWIMDRNATAFNHPADNPLQPSTNYIVIIAVIKFVTGDGRLETGFGANFRFIMTQP